MDPNRWDGVPITYKTNWNSENDEICIHRPSNEIDYLQELHKKKTSNCYYLTNKQPVWDDSKLF